MGGIAHDFNNQLTVVIGNLDFVLETLGSDAADDSLSANPRWRTSVS